MSPLPRRAILPTGRFLREWLLQAAVLLTLILLIGWLTHNLVTNLADRGITVGFDFLTRAARFPIAESILPYSPTDSFGWAFIVGFANTLFISALVIVFSTVLGFLIALARRSRHPLALGISTAFIEVSRNTPLVVQLLFWYAAVTFGLPPLRAALNPAPGFYLTDRGLFLPSVDVAGGGGILLLAFLCGAIASVTAIFVGRARRISTGKPNRIALLTLLASLALVGLTWLAVAAHLHVSHPVAGRFNFMGGTTLTPEFVAVVLGLLFYSAAFTSEVIRGGIDSISPGQWEAGRATGLTESQTLKLVVLPQALRVIIPPLTSQYITIVKNSTLALVVGFPELNFVTATTINQTGQAMEGIAILMIAFLLVSGLASLLMNAYHRRLLLSEHR